MKSDEIKDLALALSNAQANMKAAHKDSTNPFFKSKYSTLSSVWDACREVLAENGLSVVQTTSCSPEDGICVDTILMHSTGQWISGSLPVCATKKDPQGIGSAITYARRYALAAMVGVCPEDDDAESNRIADAPLPRKMADKPTTNVRQTPDKPRVGSYQYKIPFGKFKGLALEDLVPEELRGYCEYLINKSEQDGKPMKEMGIEFLERAEAYLQSIK